MDQKTYLIIEAMLSRDRPTGPQAAALMKSLGADNGMDKFYTIEETAKVLACSPWTVYRLCKDGKLPKVKLGRRFTRIKESALLEWIQSH